MFRKALPGGLTDLILILGVQAFAYAFDLPNSELSTICTLVMLGVGLAVLWNVCRPFTPQHVVLWTGMLFLGAAAAWIFAPILELVQLDLGGILILLVFWALVIPVMRGVYLAIEAVVRFWDKLTGYLPSVHDRLPF